jgi:phosphatidylglycerophosphatase C
MTGSRPVVAAFDVDGTLTVRDCVVPFLQRVGGRFGIPKALARRPLASAQAAMRRDRDIVKEIVVGGVMAGRRVADVESEGARFAAIVHDHWLRHDTLSRLRWHQQSGHVVTLVSASLGAYLRPLAGRLGIDGVVCTEAIHDGVTFGHGLDGPNCRAAEKVIRLRRWLVEQDLGDVHLWAYGDSRGDRELLQIADEPVMVRRVTITAEPR